jgi:peptidoglycan/xylan/chitin deacetylase (PgdA/CDA1 family)
MRSALRKSLYHAGVTPAYHRLHNRRTLTVVMFHRVLPAEHPEWARAEPAWTMSTDAFRDCLDFFKEHYQVISLAKALEAARNEYELPDRSLLISFDDGWADTERYALPLLEQSNLPAVVFVVADAIDQRDLWQDRLVYAHRQGHLKNYDYDALWRRAKQNGGPPPRDWNSDNAVWKLVQRFGPLAAGERQSILDELVPALPPPAEPQMLTTGQLRTLSARGMVIGSHGLTHIPMTYSEHVNRDLLESRSLLTRASGLPERQVRALSFPHGVYDAGAVDAAFEAGFELLFTSDKGLNSTRPDQGLGRILARINMDSAGVTKNPARAEPELLASWLFDRPHLALERPS